MSQKQSPLGPISPEHIKAPTSPQGRNARRLTRKKQALLVSGATVLCLLLAACGAPNGEAASGGTASPDSGAVALIKKAGVLRVGMMASSPPYITTGPDGKQVGFDPDLASALAKSMGVELKVNVVDIPGRVATLQTKKDDVVVSVFAVTPDRAKVVSFSDPYVTSHGEFLVKSSDTNLKTKEDLNRPEVTTCVTRGGTATTAVPAALPKTTILTLNSVDDCLQALLSGQATAMSQDNFYNAILMKKQPNQFKTVKGFYSDTPIAIGMTLGNDDLKAYVNNFLKKYHDSGAAAKSFEKWFGFAMPAE